MDSSKGKVHELVSSRIIELKSLIGKIHINNTSMQKYLISLLEINNRILQVLEQGPRKK